MEPVMNANIPSAQDLWRMDHDHALHPWTNFGPFEEQGALVITRGQGCDLWDAAGKCYLDAVGGLWCTNIGLGRREMAEAIADQVLTLGYSNTFVDMTNDPSARLAAKLAELAPGDLNRVHFTTGGSTAIDTAARMVQYYQSCMGRPEKGQLVAREHSYHGSTYLSQSIGKRPGDRVEEFRYKEDGIHHISAPNPYRRPVRGADRACRRRSDRRFLCRAGAGLGRGDRATQGIFAPDLGDLSPS
jgi:putrescine aminotransferase